MTSREANVGSSAGGTPTSRRSFLALAGSAVGLGLSTGRAEGRVGEFGRTVTVATSPAERDPTREAADALRGAGSDVGAPVRVAETTAALRRFAAGDVDVAVASRPILPDERARAVENGVGVVRREVPTAAAALRHPESSWLDCLAPARLAEAWAGEGVVETWAEIPRSTAAANAPTRRVSAESADARAARAESGGERRPETVTPTSGTALVRGARAFQYASGAGGVGYYDPGGGAIERRGGGAESHTPLVRLAFLYVDRASLERGAASELVDAFVRRSARRVGDARYFADPIAGG